MPSKFLRVKTAAVAALALLSIGGVAAAATGLAPGSAERTARQASVRTPDGQVWPDGVTESAPGTLW